MDLQRRLRDMFTEMVVAKDATKISEFYHPDFQLHTNGQQQNLKQFRAGHEHLYPTAITYAVEYDEDTWVQAGDRLAVRLWIAIALPRQEPRRIEVLLIGQFQAGLLRQLWELTWPDWSHLGELASYPVD